MSSALRHRRLSERPHPPEGSQPAAGPDPRPEDPPTPGHEPEEEQVKSMSIPLVRNDWGERREEERSSDCKFFHLDLCNGLLSSHLKDMSVLGTQKELHLGAERKSKPSSDDVMTQKLKAHEQCQLTSYSYNEEPCLLFDTQFY